MARRAGRLGLAGVGDREETGKAVTVKEWWDAVLSMPVDVVGKCAMLIAFVWLIAPWVWELSGVIVYALRCKVEKRG